MHSEEWSLWCGFALTLILAVLFVRGRRRYSSLPAIPAAVPDRAGALPDCMVVIPARNEEALIGKAVRTLPHDTVIVVDDGSTDRTAQAAREAGAGVLKAPELPHGWAGKPIACALGAAALTSRWVLFTDADTWFEPRFLEAAVAWAEANGLALLSIYLDPEYDGFIENALGPYVRALTFAGIATSSATSAVFRAQCLLVQREPYVFTGGHHAVAMYLFDDARLATLAERHRLKFAIARAPGLGHIRLCAGYRGVRNTIRRNIRRFARLSPRIGLTILLAAFVAALWLPELAWLARDRQWIAAAAFAFAPAFILGPWYRKWWIAVLAPLAFYGILPVLAGGLLRASFGVPVEWKGRRIRGVS